MNLGKGYLMPQENGLVHPGDLWIPANPEMTVRKDNGGVLNVNPWIPVTPEKPVMSADGAINSGDSWIPVAPEKAVMQTSNPAANETQNFHQILGLQGGVSSSEKPVMQTIYPTCDEVQGELTENTTWTGLLGLYTDVLQGTPTNEAIDELNPAALLAHGEHKKLDGAAVPVNGCDNRNSDLYVQNLLGDVTGTEMFPLVSSYQATGNEVVKYQHAISMPALSSSQGIITSSIQKIASDGTPIKYQHVYNLNSPPRAESTVVSYAANCFEFAPVTPDQEKQLKNQQLSDVQNSSTEEGLRQEKDKLELISTSSQGENHLGELWDTAAVKQPASNATSLKEYTISENRGYTGIDLNKTPQQKTPKRKKHRPKVVVEGKPKKTPKPTPLKTPKPTSEENSSVKRKYVRRKRPETLGSRPGNETFGVENSAQNSAAKPCRRVLNFDLGAGTADKSENRMVADQQQAELKSRPFDLNLQYQDKIWSKELNRIPDISAAMEGQQSAYNAEVQKGKSICNLIDDNNQKLSAKSWPPPFHMVSTSTVRDDTLNVIARSLQTAISSQNNDQFGFNKGHQPLNGEAMGKIPLQPNSSLSRFDAAQPQLLQRSTKVLKDTTKEKRGSKRDHWYTSQMINPQSAELMHSNIFHHEISRTVEQNNDSGRTRISTLGSNKRGKFDDTCCEVLSSRPSYVASIQDGSRPVEFKDSKSFLENSSSSCTHGRLPNFNLGMESTLRRHNSGGYKILTNHGTNTAAVGNGFEDQRTSSAMQFLGLLMARKDPHHNAEAHNLIVTTGTTDCRVSPSQRVPATTGGIETITPIDLLSKRQTHKPASFIQARQEKLHLNEKKQQQGCQNSSMKAKGPKGRQNYEVTINEIIDRLAVLEISRSSRELVSEEQKAIVPYKGDNKVVPYEGFDPIKRHRPRPKVDLDSETNRVWNLLMGKTESENTETTDHEKEKWWEDERKVVRGRVDSFIARMHLVQGDRRFSPWKGSVVDSVIGVFLTQNVSDHLSSSAFMSLASKFPAQLRNSNTTCCKYGSVSWIEDPDGTMTYHATKARQPLDKQSSMTLSELSGRRSEPLNWGTVIHYSNNSSIDEEVVSSQNSSESFPQLSKYMRSSSDSEVEDHIMMNNSKKNCILETTLETQRSALLQQYQCQVSTGMLLHKSPMSRYQQPRNPASNSIFPTIDSGINEHDYPANPDFLSPQGSLFTPSGSCLNKTSDIEVSGSYCSGFSDQNSMSSFFSTSMEVNKIDGAAHTSRKIGGIAGGATCSTTQETEIPINHVLRMGQTQCSNQLHRDKLSPGLQYLNSQESVTSYQVQVSKGFTQEVKSAMKPIRLDEADAERKTGHVSFSSEQLSNTGANVSNAKRKRNVDKIKAFDWDSLRRKVLSKSGKQERCPDNMDSVDYEALRLADVKKISDTIQERGMNNMLAERIKDFLNRLVRDHGSVDLEWLREVEADKAKDYLLSIRGLGLKSVECVRLLTLHQIAFPVDTNVGRIAVRLGWVPLRPLPESLQLHLLELYPVLESIQKYLWPRLCKLDQRTLYELHYQLITFGKVFCTKRKPNCNACPMRAECRHFASAFASARLALPWPEERSMANSTLSMAANEIPPITVEPVPLPAVATIMGCEADYSGSKCEPIIEEPTTPEPSLEVAESDIEDLFYEDPDEIPTIKLSLEELRTNVESVLREHNMEIQEGDLSRALVALDASTASIPVPKLKNVSRLRTEHQVYELPDSHPLLNGMERREPDDPSPYLLAIWGPGETGDLAQPSEGCPPCPHENENNSQTVRGTLLIPCRTAMRGSFPLNGTYFQVNEMFADQESSHNPIAVPRDWLWKLPRRTVYFGTSVTSIFRGLSQEGIQYCFWRGFVCVRGFDRKQRAPRPLQKRFHEPASKMVKNKNNDKQKQGNAEASNRKN